MNPRKTSGQSGFVLIELMIVTAMVFIVAAIAIPNVLSARRCANESRAVRYVRSIFTNQVTIDIEKVPDVAAFLGSIGKPGPNSSYVVGGYVYRSKPTGSSNTVWEVTAIPSNSGAGTRSFYVDATGIIREAQAGMSPGPQSPEFVSLPCTVGSSGSGSDSDSESDQKLIEVAVRIDDFRAEMGQAVWGVIPASAADQVASYLEQLMTIEFVQSAIQQIDENQDGIAQMHEIEIVDIVELARSLREAVALPDGPVISDSDEMLTSLADGFKRTILDIAAEQGDPEQAEARGIEVDEVFSTARDLANDLRLDAGTSPDPEEPLQDY